MTEATAAIGDTLLHNSVNVMTRQREEIGTTMYPLFTHQETESRDRPWQLLSLSPADQSDGRANAAAGREWPHL